ncbi:hypothetical protein N7530_001433 [Penicillium desertorum]|uniref:Helicase C-terminal domain-containing protein n=1 Tax=Penicillium desertorum TaxID=1303715 RepID=A0A9W9X9X5_9EURO|nr:hypothetical protein N7530_001433 [Penicillium desertorum]
MHAKLNDQERRSLVENFNDPKSNLKVMIITYNIGSVGLNLHEACDFVILSAPGRNWSQEAQAFGRCLQGPMDLTNVWI